MASILASEEGLVDSKLHADVRTKWFKAYQKGPTAHAKVINGWTRNLPHACGLVSKAHDRLSLVDSSTGCLATLLKFAGGRASARETTTGVFGGRAPEDVTDAASLYAASEAMADFYGETANPYGPICATDLPIDYGAVFEERPSEIRNKYARETLASIGTHARRAADTCTTDPSTASAIGDLANSNTFTYARMGRLLQSIHKASSDPYIDEHTFLAPLESLAVARAKAEVASLANSSINLRRALESCADEVSKTGRWDPTKLAELSADILHETCNPKTCDPHCHIREEDSAFAQALAATEELPGDTTATYANRLEANYRFRRWPKRAVPQAANL